MTPRVWFQYPFRIFFLSVAVWAIVAVPLWLLNHLNGFQMAPALPPLLWHEHEMIFGLLMPAIAGFLLTAVCVWTKTKPLRPWTLFGLWAVWVAARVTITFGGNLPDAVPIVLNLGFTALIFVDVARRVLPRRQWRQIPILVVLIVLFATQAAVLLLPDIQYQLSTLHASLVATCGIMMVVGGRITPAFSGGWLRRQGREEDAAKIKNPGWLQHLTFVLIIALTVLVATRAPNLWIGVVALLAAVGCLVRIALWRGWYTVKEPLLWILHLSLCWIPVGFVLLAYARLGGGIANNVWSHAIGVGAMGGLIIGVMSRVSLGHTGRKLELPAGQVTAYILMHTGAVIRIATALEWLPDRTLGLTIAGVFWSVAFILFLIPYVPILSLPRVDGKPG